MSKGILSVCLLGICVMSGAALAQTSDTATGTASGSSAQSTSTESGLAAVYTDRLAGHRTASGAKYDPRQLTAAHKTLPFGTRVKVTNTKNGKSVELKITDRGPREAGRILDISARAAHALGIRKSAMAPVTLEVVQTAH